MARKTTTKTPPAAAAPVDLFANLTTLSSPAPATPKRARTEREVPLGDDLDQLASVSAFIDSMTTEHTRLEKYLKEVCLKEFVAEAVRTGRRPENFVGTGSISEASCELRKRSTRSPLTEQQQALLKKHGITMKKVTTVQPIPELIAFNPKIPITPDLAAKISAAFATIAELSGKEVFIRQAPQPEQFGMVVSDTALDEAAATRDPEIIKVMFEMCGTQALKPKLLTQEPDTMMSWVRKTRVWTLLADLGKKIKA